MRTNRHWALWQAGIGITVCFATIVWAGGTGRSSFWSLFLMSTFISILAATGWIRASRLRERDKRNALTLVDVLVKRLPDVSLIEGPL